MAKRIPAKNGGELEPASVASKHRGRVKGTPNKVTSLIKETALSALEKVGRPRKAFNKQGKFIGWMPTGQGGLEGYIHVACINESAMMGLLGKILPQQVNVKSDGTVTHVLRTTAEVREELMRRGVPQSMIPLRLPPGRESARVGLSSLDAGVKANADGTTDVYFGPQATSGMAANWIPTKTDGRFFLLFRFYGPESSSIRRGGLRCPPWAARLESISMRPSSRKRARPCQRESA
jgi:hypothetical protein